MTGPFFEKAKQKTINDKVPYLRLQLIYLAMYQPTNHNS